MCGVHVYVVCMCTWCACICGVYVCGVHVHVCSYLLEVVYIIEIRVSKEVTLLKAKRGGECMEEGLDVLDERVL